jgi:hypothetical protein
MNFKAKILGAAMAALGMVGLSGAALAGSVTPPGERAGIDLASPLPEGVYFVDTGGPGNWRAASGTSAFDYNVPIIAWATPWTILGGRIQLIAAAPMASLSASNFNNGQGRPGPSLGSLNARGIYNPFVAAQIAFNLGNGFSASYLAGAYIAVTGSTVTLNGAPAIVNPWDQTTFHQMLALAYHGGGWNATANLLYGIVGSNNTCHCNQGVFADYFNYDLALTHTFGKWEVGIVGYGSTDTNTPYIGPGKTYLSQSQFALGGLVGYNFGPVITQFLLGSDVYIRNYTAHETRLGIHVIIPLWAPEAPKAVVAKY